MSTAPTPWWQTGTVYQIYPKSFQDTTGSGTGDLRGVIRRLGHLAELGVDAVWLTPVYRSPQVDNGYDVADYCAIDPAYGSMADFDDLVTALHARGMKLVMDMVFNHTSTEHPWFRAAVQDPEGPYRDFYIWRAPAPDGGPPNNWRSKFGGSAWTYEPGSGEYYLHLFAPEQADINWANPRVRSAVRDVIHFWARKGVDGVRLDVVNLISKTQGLPDAPDTDGREFYTDGPEVHAYLQELSGKALRPYGLMSVGEMSSTTLEHCRQYADASGRELSMTFNFHHLKVDYPGGDKWTVAPPDLVELKRLFAHWQQGMHGRAWNALFWCNHDQPRIVSRFGDDGELHGPSAKMLAMVLHGMQGTPYVYQGEEFGMTNPGYRSIGDYRDVESLNLYEERIAAGVPEARILDVLAAKSRDNGRTPMQWDDTVNGGFTTGTPWLRPAGNSGALNAASAVKDEDSVFHTYKRLIALRKELDVLVHGDYTDLDPADPRVWSYVRRHGADELLVVANFSGTPVPWDRPGVLDGGGWLQLLTNYPQASGTPTSGTLRPYQAGMWLRRG
ncbi:alpha,alpha-phosphotrehalase [Streptomyces sp. TRM66268-LWL]|uniref:Alpha,alpha-phosphotrehalase n=1 Tax=Streptomyces polyasparticus TaxID=2767826 RepID=A0ABR7SCG0_9ACTN|nr:alpha,alpha-phosphotrehalase [Streptomyces polyasparticus]MBC9712048.1 alpha,alpha-phosphotrehalase [Streptomyces polyasparticus]